MLNLIKIEVSESGKRAVSGRDLHEFLEVKSRYNDWIKRMFEYGFTENEDYVLTKLKIGIRHYEENHILTLDMAKEISMLQRSDKGSQARKYFIEVEKKFNNHEMKLMSPMEIMELQFQIIKEQQTKIEVIEHKVDKLEMDVPIYTSELDCLKQIMRLNITEQLGGTESLAYKNKSVNQRCYAHAWKSINGYLNTASYKSIKRCDYERAIDLIKNVKLPDDDKQIVDALNAQQQLNI